MLWAEYFHRIKSDTMTLAKYISLPDEQAPSAALK